MIEDTLSTIYALVDPRTEARKKISDKAKGRVVSEETKQKLFAIFTNRVVSADTKEKMSAAAK
jgi:NUMOD3 motif